ncbi:MAG: hypothetical protein AMXMBFR34_28450 [Myxococcaceae bacterium]
MTHRGTWLLLLVLAGCPNRPPKVERCATTADCSGGLTCRGETCDYCRSDADCAAPQRCGVEQAGLCGCTDRDGDGSRCDDCNDADPTVFGAAAEACDGKDNDCDGEIDEGAIPRFHADQDHDGFGDPRLSLDLCVAPSGYVLDGTDCNDADPTASPARQELCDFRDNDCDGEIDEGVRVAYFRDADGDGFGDGNNPLNTCQTPASGYVSVSGDCDDTRADVNPRARETCNARDDDCDGTVDAITRSCDNACGPGMETCAGGLWGQCTAPPIVTVTNTTTLTGTGAEFDCLSVGEQGRLVVAPEMILKTRNWLRVEKSGRLELGARARVEASGDITFADFGSLLATDATLKSGGTVQVNQDARWFAQAPQAPPYSGGGSAACAIGTTQGVGGAGGGARGGNGGQGGSCGPLVTQPTVGAGGPSAAPGTDGCDCNCTQGVPGGAPSGGGGAGYLAGGGGGANGGRGGNGGSGAYDTTSGAGGVGGLAEANSGTIPQVGGAGGGSAGTTLVSYAPEACQGGGGAGGGIVRVEAQRFANSGVLFADGAPGHTAMGSYSHAGGGGGGAGGSWVFLVDRLTNTGSLSAVGGAGGLGRPNGAASLPGGGGGGGGGVVYVAAPDGGAPALVSLGNIFVGGGVGGTGPGGAGTAGANGWVYVQP